MRPKSLISAEAKKSPIKDILNYLRDIQRFIAYFASMIGLSLFYDIKCSALHNYICDDHIQ